MGQRCAVECLPVRLGGKGLEVLIGTPVEGRTRGPDDSAKIRESFFIDLVIFEELGVVTKISKKPVEFPESSFGAVQPAREKPGFERSGFQNCKSDLYERLLRMPSVARPIHADKE
jgi:hypothetical protein